MMRVRLFTSAFPDQREWRRAEYAECLRRNLACAEIDEVFVLAEAGSDLDPQPKLVITQVQVRPSYSDYLALIRSVAAAGDVSIIANSDIYFDEGIGVLRDRLVPPDTVLALSRWESAGREARLNDRNDSQDAWVFRGLPRDMSADYAVGVPRCDNRFAKELERAGYVVRNPSFSIRAWHLHSEARGEYPVEHREDFVEGPYGYVWPHNLMSLPHSLLHNMLHPRHRVGWRLDGRRLRRALRLDSITNAVRGVRA